MQQLGASKAGSIRARAGVWASSDSEQGSSSFSPSLATALYPEPKYFLGWWQLLPQVHVRLCSRVFSMIGGQQEGLSAFSVIGGQQERFCLPGTRLPLCLLSPQLSCYCVIASPPISRSKGSAVKSHQFLYFLSPSSFTLQLVISQFFLSPSQVQKLLI